MADAVPVEISAALTNGATFHGVAVELVILRLIDGRRHKFEPPETATGGVSDRLSQTQERILAILKSSPVPMKRAAVAKQLHRKGGVRGKLGADFRFLLSKDKIFEGGNGVTDDPSKFSVTT